MEVELRNIGPIAKGTVKVHPLTVFAGPSNSGKTFMATAIYAAAQAVSEHTTDPLMYYDAMRHFKRVNTKIPRLNPGKPNPPTLDNLSDLVLENLPRCFGISMNDLISNTPKGNPKRTAVSLSVSCSKWKVYPIHKPSEKDPSGTRGYNKKIQEIAAKVAADKEWHYDPQSLYGGHLNTPVYLPAERGGLIQAWETMAASIVQNSSRSFRGLQIPSLKGSMADLLTQIIDPRSFDQRSYGRLYELTFGRMAPKMEGNKKLRRIIKTELGKILDGSIFVIKNDARTPEIRYQRNRMSSIPLKSAASAISELSPISIFSDYNLISKHSIFILEEPESHLHPAAQRAMARLLIIMANNGVSVIITTHSPIILEELSYWIRAEAALKENKNSGSVSGDQESKYCISSEDVAIYHFHQEKSKSSAPETVVQKIPTNEIKTEGILIPDHEAELGALYNQQLLLDDPDV